MRRRPKKFLNNSNKMLTALVCILAVVCLVAGGIYIDTFHGQGRFLALIGKTNRTQAQEEDAVMQNFDSSGKSFPQNLHFILIPPFI